MLQLFLITQIFLIINFIQTELTIPEEDITEEMKWYIMRTTVSLSSIYDTVGIIGLAGYNTRGIVTHLLTKKNVDAVLLGTRKKPYIKHRYLETTINLFCFVNTINEFEAMVNYSNTNPFFNQQGFIQFIVGEKVNNTDWLMDRLKFIWSHDITNYCIVFQIEATIQVIGYNPFNGSIYNFTNHPLGQKIYPDKLLNLYGFRLKVGMLLDYPRNDYNIDGVFVGEDIQLLESILYKMNATHDLKTYTNIIALRDDIKARKLHFGFTRTFTFSSGEFVVEPSYPVQIEYWVIIVPTATLMPRYKYLFLIFGKLVWVAIFISILTMTLIIVFFARRTKFKHRSVSDLSLTTLQIFLNTAYIYFNYAKTSFKVLLMAWTFYSLLMSTAFSTTLRTSLINLKYNHEILTLDDLKASNLKVAINPAVLKDVLQEFDFLKNQLLYINNTFEMIAMLEEHKKDMAFVLSLTFAEKLVNKKDPWNRFYYRILDRYMIAGHNVYSFAHNSPYAGIFNNYILLFKQFAFSSFGLRPQVYKNLVSGEDMALSLEHIQAAFFILFIGYGTGLFAFLIEQSYFKRCRKPSQQKIIPFLK